ncbi:MAG TPA: hypothetical protein VHF58_11835, partial [Solirubrobacterales bacterium]|nr:hypothetical protein [Solirubrobacterales bacterium]
MSRGSPPVRLAVIGLGTVGEWLLQAIERDRPTHRERYGVDIEVVAIARGDGLVASEQGIPVADAIELK